MNKDDLICINPGLDIYKTVHAATAADSAAVIAAATCAAAVASRGIGRIVDVQPDWIRITWLRGEQPWIWWYKESDIKASFTVMKDNSIVRILYGTAPKTTSLQT